MKTIEFVVKAFIIIENKAKLKTPFCPHTVLPSIGSSDVTLSFRILKGEKNVRVFFYTHFYVQ